MSHMILKSTKKLTCHPIVIENALWNNFALTMRYNKVVGEIKGYSTIDRTFDLMIASENYSQQQKGFFVIIDKIGIYIFS